MRSAMQHTLTYSYPFSKNVIVAISETVKLSTI